MTSSTIRVKRTPLVHRGPPPPVEPTPQPYQPGPSSPDTATSPFSPWVNIGFENLPSLVPPQYTSYPYFTLPLVSPNTTTVCMGQDKYENFDIDAFASFQAQFPAPNSDAQSNTFDWNTADDASALSSSIPDGAVPFVYGDGMFYNDTTSALLDPGVGELAACSSQMSYGALTDDPSLSSLTMNVLSSVAPLSEAFLDADGQPIEPITAADWARLDAIEAEIEGWRIAHQQTLLKSTPAAGPPSSDGNSTGKPEKPQLTPLQVDGLVLESSSDSEVHSPASDDSPDTSMEVEEHEFES